MGRYNPGGEIVANGDYDVFCDPGKRYAFEVYYPSGVTATVTIKQKSPNGSDYQAATWGADPTTDTDMAIAATGTARGSDLRATSGTIRFTVASLTGGAIRIAFYEIPHGRS